MLSVGTGDAIYSDAARGNEAAKPGNWFVSYSWELAARDMLTLREETNRLTALPALGFALQTTIAVACHHPGVSGADQRRCPGRSTEVHRWGG